MFDEACGAVSTEKSNRFRVAPQWSMMLALMGQMLFVGVLNNSASRCCPDRLTSLSLLKSISILMGLVDAHGDRFIACRPGPGSRVRRSKKTAF